MDSFTGAKVALIKDDEVLVILRDDKPGLPNANMWDFPGGGREGDETPFECLAREVREELGIEISRSSIIWEKACPAMNGSDATGYFMVAPIDDAALSNIVFGDEGQGWKMMKVEDFLADPTVIGALKSRLGDFFASKG